MAAKGSDSRQGLIIALVIAVLFVIGLAVSTYYGFAGQEDLAKKEKDARTAEANAKKSRDWYQFLATQYKTYVGYPSKQDLNDLSALRGRYESGAIGKGESNFAENDAVIKKLDDRSVLGWNLVESRPIITASEKIDTLAAENRDLRKKLEAAQAETKQAQDAQRRAETVAADAEANYKKTLAKLNNELVNTQAEAQKKILEARADFEKENKRVEEAEKKLQAEIEAREK